MTVPANDDPEIVVEGTDPAPSAPPAASSSDLPTAIATPVVASAPDATAPPLAAATTTNAGGNVERTTNADGSLTVKITTTRTQPNGYREVTTEHFYIPAGVVSTAALSLDQGDPPSSLYMTRMEQQTLPPGTGEVTTRPPAYPTPGFENTQPHPERPNAPASQESNDDSAANRNRRHALGGVLTGIVAVVIIALGISRSSDNNNSPSWSPPSPSYTPWPSPSSPSWPSHTYPWSSPSHPIWHDSPTASPYPTSSTPWPAWPTPARPASPTASPAPTTTNWWTKPVDEWPFSSPQPTTRQEGKRRRKEERKN